ASMGMTPAMESDDRRFVEALRHICTTARKYGVAPGIHVANHEAARRRIEEGFQFIALASDLRFMLAAARDELARTGFNRGEVVKERYGAEFYGQIGRKGGSTTKTKYGPEHYAEIGRRGGQTTSERHGPQFYEQIGKKGGQRVRELIERGKQSE